MADSDTDHPDPLNIQLELDIENVHDEDHLDIEDELGEFDEATASFLEGHCESDASESGDTRIDENPDFVSTNESGGQDAEPDFLSEKDSGTKDEFMTRWLEFINDRGISIEPFIVSGREIEIFDLYRQVCSLGGLDSVIASKQMARVAVDLGYKRSPDLRLTSRF